ncbi:MAG: hypothetical protein IH852_14890 [Bacteroidetes bacterium]|nr:hypothetical protein [Bacteroidota bacterium]
MKKLIIILVLIFWGFVGVSEITAHPRVSGYFYTGLSPYGSWIEIDYGVVVWRPTIMRMDWSPYRDGRWIWTSDGWYWQSYEPFGYITYHYGRWYFDDYYGWLWYPDYEWAPAWVEWRYDDDYIGWAPLHPYAVFSISIGIHFTTHYYTPYYHWNFVGYNHFYDPYVYNHCVGPRYKYRVYSNTRYRTNYVYHNGRIRNNGVDIRDVRKRSGQNIRQRDLLHVSDPVSLDSRNRDNNKKIRTFYKSRDELTRNEVKDVQITKSSRNSSLDVSRVKIGRMKDRNVKTFVDKDKTKRFKKNEREKYSYTKKKRTNNERKIKTSDVRKKSGNDVEIKKKTGKVNDRKLREKDYKKVEKKNIKKNNSRITGRNEQKKEVKVNRKKNKNVQTKSDIKKRVDKTFSERNKKTTVNKNTNNVKKTIVKTNRGSNDNKKKNRSRR